MGKVYNFIELVKYATSSSMCYRDTKIQLWLSSLYIQRLKKRFAIVNQVTYNLMTLFEPT